MLANIKCLVSNPLFKNMNYELLLSLINQDQCVLCDYKKGSLIVQEGEPCSSIGFILSGTLVSQ